MLAQIQIINYLLDTKDYSIISDNNISEDYFIECKNEFNFIQNHYKTYGQIPDSLTFLKVFPDFTIAEVGEAKSYLISELHRERDEAFLAKTFNKIKDLVMAGKTDDAMNLFQSSSLSVADNRNMNAIDILDDISRYDAYIDKCTNFNKYYVQTGFDELDAIISGFDKNEELAVIAARPGVGKSFTLIKCITAAVKQGLRVGLFSGEMSVTKCAYRFDSMMSHISNGALIHGNIGPSAQYQSYLTSLKENHTGNLFVITRDMIDGKCGVNALSNFVEKYKIDILFIDQLSLLDDDHNAKQSFDRAANISKDLKILQTKKRIPIISASQLNRSNIEEGGFAGTENIAQSDRIAQDATLILSLSSKDDIMTIHISKARDGGTGKTLNYMVDLDKGMYTYIPDMDDAQFDDSSEENSNEEDMPF